MEQLTPPRTPKAPLDREFIIRIAVCCVAVVALCTAITLMIRSIVMDANATKRFLAEAFQSSAPDNITPPTTTESESSSAPESSIFPAETTVPSTPQSSSAPLTTTPEAELISLVSASLSHDKAAITNYTSYAVDENALSQHKFTYYTGKTSPLVLILHSHINECYAPEGESAVSASFPFESNDKKNNIFAVGEAIADLLSASGIGVIHISEEVTNPEKTIKEYREAYPSIHFVLDVHRDGMYTTDGRIVRTDGKINQAPAAELMLAVGTNAENGGSDWQGNLAAAYQLSGMITEAEKQIMRKTLLRPESLGQQYAPCSLSLYVGTTGNTLFEALTSARFFARYYAIFILSSVK